jgi:adenylate cyclase
MSVFRRVVRLLTLPPAVQRVVGGALCAIIVVAAILFEVIEPFELDALDRLFRLRGPRPTTAPIVIVAIDEDSFDELGEEVPVECSAEDSAAGKCGGTKPKGLAWPFPRVLHGTLLEMIASGGPRVIGVDLIFAEPSVHGEADDKEFADAIKRARKVVLGAAITEVSEGFYRKADTNLPMPALREGALAYAPVNPTLDEDAVVRRVPLRHVVGDRRLATTKTLPECTPTTSVCSMDGFDFTLYRVAAATGLAVAPLPRRNEIIINYRGHKQTFPWVAYHRVVKGDVDPQIFKDKIVLVGTTTAVLHDIFPTPFERSGQMPGVEIHAHAIDTLVRGDRIREAPPWLSPVLALVFAPLGAWLVLRLRALRAFAAVAAIWATLFLVSLFAFSTWHLWIRQVGPSAALALGYVATSIEHFIREQREKRRLSQFFSPDVLREIVRHREGVNLGSARRLITVFFSDLRGFTSLSERMEPEVVAEMLKEYLTEMTEVVFRHAGTVDKYIGDCVMAIWNAPFDDPNHAVNAVRTALDFQEKTLAVSAKWEAKLGGKIRNGVGINTGEAVVGTMGSLQRLEYTAIGDTVNLAARLESITKEYNTAIIISENTYDYVKGQFMTRELGAVTVKGKARPVKIYAVLPTDIRRHPRASLASAAVVTLDGLGQTFTVQTKDISETGIALTGVPDDLEKGTEIEVRCEGGGLPKPIVAHGMIVWKRGDSVGVSFTQPTGDVGPAVASYVASHEARNRQAKN